MDRDLEVRCGWRKTYIRSTSKYFEVFLIYFVAAASGDIYFSEQHPSTVVGDDGRVVYDALRKRCLSNPQTYDYGRNEK